jgi:hypothetical protein
MFIPLMTRPTRITSHTATLIDNIFTNQLSHCLKSGLLFTDISDHLPVFSICFEDKTYTRNVNDVIVFRDKNKQNVAKFNEKLGNVRDRSLNMARGGGDGGETRNFEKHFGAPLKNYMPFQGPPPLCILYFLKTPTPSCTA